MKNIPLSKWKKTTIRSNVRTYIVKINIVLTYSESIFTLWTYYGNYVSEKYLIISNTQYSDVNRYNNSRKKVNRLLIQARTWKNVTGFFLPSADPPPPPYSKFPLFHYFEFLIGHFFYFDLKR